MHSRHLSIMCLFVLILLPQNAVGQAMRSFSDPMTDFVLNDAFRTVDLGFDVDLGVGMFEETILSSNGNLTFGRSSPFSDDFLASNLEDFSYPTIAPFWSDVDDSGSSVNPSELTYGQVSVDGHDAFVATWENVGYFDSVRVPGFPNPDQTNDFQVIIIDRSDVTPGAFHVEFNYDQILWEVGDIATVRPTTYNFGGFGTPSAVVGLHFDTAPGTHFQFDGSLVPGSFLDGGPQSLVDNSNVGLPGRYLFCVYGGFIVSCPEYSSSSDPYKVPFSDIALASAKRMSQTFDFDGAVSLATNAKEVDGLKIFAFGDAFAARAHDHSGNPEDSSTYHMTSGYIGATFPVDPRLQIGGYVGIHSLDGETDGFNADFEAQGGSVGLFFKADPAPYLQVSGGVGGQFLSASYDHDQGSGPSVSGDTDLQTGWAHVKVSTPLLPLGDLKLNPFVRVFGASLHQDGFQESGDNGLDYPTDTAHSLTASAGLNATYAIKVFALPVSIKGSLALDREFSQKARTLNVVNPSGGIASLSYEEADRVVFPLDLRVSTMINRAEVSLGYQGVIGRDEGDIHGGYLRARVPFL